MISMVKYSYYCLYVFACIYNDDLINGKIKIAVIQSNIKSDVKVAN